MVAMAGQGEVAGATERVPEVPGEPIGGNVPGDVPGGVLDLVGDPTIDEVCLPNRPESATCARQLARTVLESHWQLPGSVTDDAVLLVSELVGNAVRHTGAHVFGLRMMRRRGWIRVEVRDPSRGLPCLLPVQGLDTSGRGLFLVDTLTDRWGVDLLPRGKTTWFEMRINSA
jgi:anti-sigma regulatory factor (Ser/Thr protein kinase)